MAASDSKPVEEARSTSPLLSAIADLRDFLPRLFEEQKALLQGRELDSAAIPSPSDTASPSPQSPASAPTPPRISSPPAVSEGTSTGRKTSARPVEPKLTPALETAPPPPPLAPTVVDPGPGSRPDDPRQRLDALAKLLDKRAKPNLAPAAKTGDP